MDSLWLSEMVFGPLIEPFAGMAYALARTRKLKVGTGCRCCRAATRCWWPSS